MACEYCEDCKDIIRESEHGLDAYVYVDDEDRKLVASFVDNCMTFIVCEEIDFCPKCGRDLKEAVGWIQRVQ